MAKKAAFSEGVIFFYVSSVLLHVWEDGQEHGLVSIMLAMIWLGSFNNKATLNFLSVCTVLSTASKIQIQTHAFKIFFVLHGRVE